MKKFNVCNTYGQTLLRGTRHAVEIPKNCFYGKDTDGLYYILDTKPYKTDEGTVYMELYRFKGNKWQVGMESGETVELIHRIATANNLYRLPQSKCLHMNSVVQSRIHTRGSRHTKVQALKDVSKKVAERGSYSNIYKYQ